MTPATATTAEVAQHRDDVRKRLDQPDLCAMATSARAGDTGAVRALYRELGEQGLLTPDWPAAYGGGNVTTAHAVATYEELATAGIPDVPYVLTVQIVGNFILKAGGQELKQLILPRISSGQCLASVLYSEPAGGSDLGALTTKAEPCDGGYLITGSKTWSLYTDSADIAIIAARTSSHSSRYLGISLFVIDLATPGIRLTKLPTLQDEQFFRTDLTNVFVPRERLVGEEGEGWALLDGALATERTGIDHAIRAQRWLRMLRSVAIAPDDPRADVLSQLTLRVDGAMSLARLAAGRLLDGDIRSLDMALTKLVTSHTAQDVAIAATDWIGEGAGHDLPPCVARELDSATREGPGLTLSAGTSEVMLSLAAAELAADPDRSLAVAERSQDQPTFAAASAVIRAAAAMHKADPIDAVALPERHDHMWRELTDSKLAWLEAPTTFGGFDLELKYGLAVCEALGAGGVEDCYGPAAMLLDIARAQPELNDYAAEVLNGVPVRWHSLPNSCAAEDMTAPGRLLVTVQGDASRVGIELMPPLESAAPVTSIRCDDRLRFVPAAQLRQAALVLGLSLATLREVLSYAQHRKQFGMTLLSHQAVAFPLASLIAEVDVVRAVLRGPAERPSTEQDAALAARILARASELGRHAARHAIHFSGARGLTGASRCSGLYVRLRDETARWGSPGQLWRLATLIDETGKVGA